MEPRMAREILQVIRKIFRWIDSRRHTSQDSDVFAEEDGTREQRQVTAVGRFQILWAGCL